MKNLNSLTSIYTKCEQFCYSTFEGELAEYAENFISVLLTFDLITDNYEEQLNLLNYAKKELQLFKNMTRYDAEIDEEVFKILLFDIYVINHTKWCKHTPKFMFCLIDILYSAFTTLEFDKILQKINNYQELYLDFIRLENIEFI